MKNNSFLVLSNLNGKTVNRKGLNMVAVSSRSSIRIMVAPPSLSLRLISLSFEVIYFCVISRICYSQMLYSAMLYFPFFGRVCSFRSLLKNFHSLLFSVLDRSSHQRCSIKKGVLKNFAKFTGKHLCQSFFFNKVAGLRPATLLKKRLWHRCFPVNFTKFLRTPFLQNTSGRLLRIRAILNLPFEA